MSVVLTAPCATGRRTGQTPAERLIASFVVEASGCWRWTGRIAGNGYGQLSINDITHPAHRLMYELCRGPIDALLLIDHLCRNIVCVNPDHLEPVTAAENVRRGSCAKLTIEQVRAIRDARECGEGVRALARRFGVDHSVVSRLTRGLVWRDDRPAVAL